MKELLAFPPPREAVTESTPMVDSQEIKDRILTLKLMFDDSSKLRQQRDFLNTHGQNVMTNPEAGNEGLGLVREFNQKNLQIHPKQEECLAGGVQGEPKIEGADPRGNTRMISSIIKQVREQKKAILLNHELKKDQDLNLMSNNPDVYQSSQVHMPSLSQQATQIDQFLPELVELKQVVDATANDLNEAKAAEAGRVDPALSLEARSNMYQAAMPLKNDFVFNFDAYENHRKEIQEKHLQRNAARDEQISEILTAKAAGEGVETNALK